MGLKRGGAIRVTGLNPRKKRAKPRRTKAPRCVVRGCTKIARYANHCKKHATTYADAKLSRQVRLRQEASCAAKHSWTGAVFDCKGALQCCHLVSRRYRNTRWDRDNVVSMCAAHHFWFDNNPLERERTIIQWLGKERWEALKAKALSSSIDWRDAMIALLEADDD